MDTLHIKIAHGMSEELRLLGKARGMTVSELVRQAIFICYQVDLIGLSDRQKQALEAYRGGFISLGKLSELMGRTAMEMRKWLKEHHIPLNTAFSEDDVENAR
jgi:hypothetical protein